MTEEEIRQFIINNGWILSPTKMSDMISQFKDFQDKTKREEKEGIAEMLLAKAQLSADFPSFHADMVAWACEALKGQ